MRTSDIISPGSRPLLPTASAGYRQEPKDILNTKLQAALKYAAGTTNARAYDPYLYEFPGDRTYERYVLQGGVNG